MKIVSTNLEKYQSITWIFLSCLYAWTARNELLRFLWVLLGFICIAVIYIRHVYPKFEVKNGIVHFRRFNIKNGIIKKIPIDQIVKIEELYKKTPGVRTMIYVPYFRFHTKDGKFIDFSQYQNNSNESNEVRKIVSLCIPCRIEKVEPEDMNIDKSAINIRNKKLEEENAKVAENIRKYKEEQYLIKKNAKWWEVWK